MKHWLVVMAVIVGLWLLHSSTDNSVEGFCGCRRKYERVVMPAESADQTGGKGTSPGTLTQLVAKGAQDTYLTGYSPYRSWGWDFLVPLRRWWRISLPKSSRIFCHRRNVSAAR